MDLRGSISFLFMTRRRPSQDELALWRQVATSVRPLRHKARQASSIERAESKTQKQPPSLKGDIAPVATTARAPRQAPLPPVSPPPLEQGGAAGLDRRQRDRFRKGKMEIDGRLDLHGHTQGEAHDELLAFLRARHAKGARCVLVITGKGMTASKGGILRQAVPRWLNEPAFRPMILAYEQARMQHGGEGALYVLLKRTK